MTPCSTCLPQPCDLDDDYALYSVQNNNVPSPSVTGDGSCGECAAVPCGTPNEESSSYDLYSLQREIFPVVLPFGLVTPSGELRLACCDGSEVIRNVPQGLSAAQFRLLFALMLDECALKAPFCSGGVSGGVGGAATIQLDIRCCDNSHVVRQVALTAPAAQITTILAQMVSECSLNSGCAGTSDGYLAVITAINSVDSAITQAITSLGVILGGFITNTPTSLENASTLLELTATTLDNAGTSLENAINTLLNQGGITSIQIAVLNVGLEIANVLHVISDLLDILGDLAHTLSVGGDISSIITQLVNLTGSLDNAATDLETSITNLLAVVTVTPCITLFADVGLVVAETLRVVGDIIVGYSAGSVLAAAFHSNVPSELTSAATVATNAGNALTSTATELGTRLTALQAALTAAIAAGCAGAAAQIQSDINLGNAMVAAYLCLATALVRMAAVATAQATGVGMPAALAALEAVAVCLESAATQLIATGDSGATSLADILQDLADGLRQLALGNITAEEASELLQRTFLITLIESITALLRFTLDFDQLWRVLLDDVMFPVSISLRCACDNYLVTRTIPSGLSASQRNAVYAEMISVCTQRCPPSLPGNQLPPSEFGPDGNPTPLVTYGNTPQSCTSFCPSGEPFIYTIPSNFYIGFNQSQVNLAAYTLACQRAVQSQLCLSAFPTSLCYGAISRNIVASGGLSGSGNVWLISSGALPAGLSLVPHGTFVTISGTTTAIGTFNFSVRVVTASGASMTRAYSVFITQIQPQTLPQMVVDVPYSVQFSMSGVGGTQTFAVGSGTLPTGLTLSESGLLSGTPTQLAGFIFGISGTSS